MGEGYTQRETLRVPRGLASQEVVCRHFQAQSMLEALQSFMDKRKRAPDSMTPEDFADGLETMDETSGEAYKKVSTLAAAEVQ
jgi:hypothetical protein